MAYLSSVMLLEFSLCLILQELLLQVESAPHSTSKGCDNAYIREQSIANQCRYMYRRSSQLSSFYKPNDQIAQTHEYFQDPDQDEHVAAQILGLYPPHYNNRLNPYPIDSYVFNYESNYARYKRYDENKITVDKTQPSVFQIWPNADTNYNRKFRRNVEELLYKCCSTGCTTDDFTKMCDARYY